MCAVYGDILSALKAWCFGLRSHHYFSSSVVLGKRGQYLYNRFKMIVGFQEKVFQMLRVKILILFSCSKYRNIVIYYLFLFVWIFQ